MTALTFHSMLLASDGYGRASGLTMQSLLMNGATVYANPMIAWSAEHTPPEVYRLKDVPKLPTTWGIVMAWPPTLWDQCTNPCRMGHTMLEGTIAPAWYVEAVNRMDVLTVPSSFVKIVLSASGVNVPVHVVSYGMDGTYFWGDLRRDDVCTFGTLGTLNIRKGTDILLRCFPLAFPTEQDVRLEVKSRGPYPIKITDPRITVHTGEWSPARTCAWYQSIDGYVSPTRGEGWGLTIAEAMLCGCAVIATNWSGCTDLLDVSYSYPLDIAGLRPVLQDDNSMSDFGEWAIPDEDHLIELMRRIYQNRTEARAKGLRASRAIRERFPMARPGRQILDILEGKAQ